MPLPFFRFKADALTPAIPADAPDEVSMRARLQNSMREAGRLAHMLARGLRDVALPAQCIACRAPVQDVGLCPSCWSQLAIISRPYCPRLGIPFVYDPGEDVFSVEAINHPPAFLRARAAVLYDDIAATLVHAFKYHDRTDLAPPLARMMLQAGRELLDDADCLLPVPLHWRRALARRTNQSALLAHVISKQANVPVVADLLRRTKPTAHQVGLSRGERADNVQGAFNVPPGSRDQVRGRKIVLIDDVLTSGATADTCARALLRAGAAQVDVLVFARVVDRPGAPI